MSIKKRTKYFLIFVLTFLVATSVWAAIDHETLGVAPGAPVTNILQITGLNDGSTNVDARDWIPCWGVNPWSRDGQKIVYQSKIDGTNNTYNEICIINADGTGYARLTTNTLCDSHGNFTPDGTKIVFQREADYDDDPATNDVAHIWIMDKDGSNPIDLTEAHDGPVLTDGCEQKPMVSLK